jgi:hypothetical protein
MKTKSKKPRNTRAMKKPHNTLAKNIESQADIDAAIEIALHGSKRGEIENLSDQFLWWYEGNQKLIALGQSEQQPERKAYAENVISCAESLSEKLLWAIVKRDGQSLRRLAEFVEKWKRSAPHADSRRAAILIFKQILNKRREKMTIQKLAGLLNRKLAGDKPVTPESSDGHAALRRLCHKLKFPIAPDAKGRRRKTQTRKA